MSDEEDNSLGEDMDVDAQSSEMEEEFEDDEEDPGNEFFAHDEEPPSRKLVRTSSFEVLSQETIMSASKDLIEGVRQVCSIPTSAAAAALLRHFKWNKEKLIESYLENPQKVCRDAGMSTFELETPLKGDPKAITSCLICLEEMPNANTFALSCGHRYCRDCWNSYLDVKIKEGPRCVFARCPSPKCNSIVHEEAYKKLSSKQNYEKYKVFLFRSYVDDNAVIKWCPAPGCTNAIHCERTTRKLPVKCKCGFEFCFRCADYEIGAHNPVDCEHLERWLQKASDESENVKWLMGNTKKCPKCRSPIEKNGGCMHMTCRISSCGYEFCWLCRGPWSEHGSATGGYYQCNKYDASDAKKEDQKAQDIKTELETYMFYFHRYESHRNAGKIADEQRKNCQKKELQLLERFDVRSQDTKFLMEATEQLILNRRALQYSYVMGYYLDKTKSAEKNLFEYLQEDLEKHTNHLSEIYELETVNTYHDFIKWKEEVTNYTRVTKKFLENFLEGTSEGLTYAK